MQNRARQPLGSVKFHGFRLDDIPKHPTVTNDEKTSFEGWPNELCTSQHLTAFRTRRIQPSIADPPRAFGRGTDVRSGADCHRPSNGGRK